jgi:hypothetical protein
LCRSGPVGERPAGPAGSGGLDIANTVRIEKEITVPGGGQFSSMVVALCPGTNYVPTGFRAWQYSGSSQFTTAMSGTSLKSSGQYWGEYSVFNNSAGPSIFRMELTYTPVLGGANNPSGF